MKRSQRLLPALLAATASLLVCAVLVACGSGAQEQQLQGEGWRLLPNGGRKVPVSAIEAESFDMTPQIATSPDQLDSTWQPVDGSSLSSSVDFDKEVVLSFTTSFGDDCPKILKEIVFDHDKKIVYSDFVRTTRQENCNAIFAPREYLVAVERSYLPEAPFRVQLQENADDYPWSRDATLGVLIDLGQDGSTASEGDLTQGRS